MLSLKNEKTQLTKDQLKNRQVTRIFEEIDDELNLLVAESKFNFSTCKISDKTLALTLYYIEDTKKLCNILKTRINLLMETTT